MNVSDIMTRTTEVIGPDATLAQAADRMRALNVGVLPVHDGERIVGVLTDRDITIRAIAGGLDPSTAAVREAMTPNAISCYEDQTVEDAARTMAENSIRRLVVLDRGRQLVGTVSIDDLAVDDEDRPLIGEILEHVVEHRRASKTPYGHILVALDGSSLAEEALAYVVPAAMGAHSKVTLLTALSAIDGMYVQSATGPPSESDAPGGQVDSSRQAAIGYLSSVKQRLREQGIGDVEFEHPAGRSAAEVIVHRARHLGADLIVMTSHGRGRVRHGVFGGVAEEVLRTTPCSVLLVKAHGG
jgi:nucleotide-binding universal stress UspA family protein/CBS domain-containing protein